MQEPQSLASPRIGSFIRYLAASGPRKSQIISGRVVAIELHDGITAYVLEDASRCCPLRGDQIIAQWFEPAAGH